MCHGHDQHFHLEKIGGGGHGKREKDGLEIVLRFGQVEDRERREGFRAGKKQRGKRDRWEMKGAAGSSSEEESGEEE